MLIMLYGCALRADAQCMNRFVPSAMCTSAIATSLPNDLGDIPSTETGLFVMCVLDVTCSRGEGAWTARTEVVNDMKDDQAKRPRLRVQLIAEHNFER